MRRWVLLGAAALIVLTAAVLWRARGEALERERAQRRAAEREASLAVETNRIMERNRHDERAVLDAARDGREAILAQPGGVAPLPHDVLDAWRAGLERLRASNGAD